MPLQFRMLADKSLFFFRRYSTTAPVSRLTLQLIAGFLSVAYITTTTTTTSSTAATGHEAVQSVYYRTDLRDQLYPEAVQYIRSRRGHPLLVFRGYKFRRNGGCKEKGYWRCASFCKCPGRVTTVDGIIVKYHVHNHDPPFFKESDELF